MKIVKGKLISVSESDLEGCVFYNDKVIEVGDGCFNEMPSLKKLILPNATTFGRDCLSYNQALTTVDLPNATTFGSDCLRSNQALTTVDLPNATTFGSYCLRYNQALTTVDLPNATTFGSDCLSYNQALTTVDLPNATTFGSYCLSSNQALTTVSIKNKKYDVRCVDGDLFVITSNKTSKGIQILTGYNFISMTDGVVKKKECFVAAKENFTAHGETVKQAIGDLQFKIVAEQIKKNPIYPDTKITVMYYRTVTGACELGVKEWMNANNLNDTQEITAAELLPILEKSGAWGVDIFKSLVTF